MSAVQEPLGNRPKCRVELHVHLDASIRHETIWEMMKKKGLPLPGSGSLEDLKTALVVREPINLSHFLKPFGIFMSAFLSDLEAIERISYEFVEDQAKQCVAYTEARYCPHLLLKPKDSMSTSSRKDVTADDILQASLRGIQRGEKEFDTKVNLILVCIRGHTEYAWDILRLCEEYRDKGVVGIDINGDGTSSRDEINTPIEIEVFKAAKEKGIRRTAHAGGAGPAKDVQAALDDLYAERIGHGYRVVEDEAIYQRCLSERIHFETCPYASYLTGSMNSLQTKSKRHPILRFAEDNASFSINKDGRTLTGKNLSDEYQLVQSWGFTEAQITRANFEAVRHSFLPEKDKMDLLKFLRESYGIYSVFNKPTSHATASDLVKTTLTKAAKEQASNHSLSEVVKESVSIMQESNQNITNTKSSSKGECNEVESCDDVKNNDIIQYNDFLNSQEKEPERTRDEEVKNEDLPKKGGFVSKVMIGNGNNDVENGIDGGGNEEKVSDNGVPEQNSIQKQDIKSILAGIVCKPKDEIIKPPPRTKHLSHKPSFKIAAWEER